MCLYKFCRTVYAHKIVYSRQLANVQYEAKHSRHTWMPSDAGSNALNALHFITPEGWLYSFSRVPLEYRENALFNGVEWKNVSIYECAESVEGRSSNVSSLGTSLHVWYRHATLLLWITESLITSKSLLRWYQWRQQLINIGGDWKLREINNHCRLSPKNCFFWRDGSMFSCPSLLPKLWGRIPPSLTPTVISMRMNAYTIAPCRCDCMTDRRSTSWSRNSASWSFSYAAHAIIIKFSDLNSLCDRARAKLKKICWKNVLRSESNTSL